MTAIARRITSTWGAIAILLIGIIGGMGVAGLLSARSEPTTSAVSSLASGSDSERATQLRERLPDAQGSTAIVLYTADSGTLSPEVTGALQQAARALPGATGAPAIPSEDGTALMVPVPVEGTDSEQVSTAVKDLRAAARADLPAGVSASVTGPAAVRADLAGVFDGADLRLLMATAAIVAVLLIITYRSPVLWLVPLLVVGASDRIASTVATSALDAVGLPWDASTTGILSVLVFGAGTDYSLLLISRYRDELRHHTDRREALVRAMVRTFEAIGASAVTVMLGVLALALSVFPMTRGLGVACAVGVFVAALFVLVALPAALALCPRGVFWPRVPRATEAGDHTGATTGATPTTPDTDAHGTTSRSVWRRVGDAVARRPRAVVAGSLAILALASLGGIGLKEGLTPSQQFISTPEAITAGDRLTQSYPGGTADPALVLTTADPQTVLAAVRSTPGVSSARVSAEGDGVTQISAVLQDPTGTDGAKRAVTDLRAAVDGIGNTHVAGGQAVAMDTSDGWARDRMVIMPAALAVVLLALMLLLRALVAPVLLMLTVVATFVASIGLGWLASRTLFGFDAFADAVVLYAFVFLVALGTDYNIFLVTRAREEAAKHGTREGMLRSLGATGAVITSAGVVLAGVFAVLGVLPLVALAQVGIIIFIGVLLDTFLVRTVLVPALAVLLGERFWWPGRSRTTFGA